MLKGDKKLLMGGGWSEGGIRKGRMGEPGPARKRCKEDAYEGEF